MRHVNPTELEKSLPTKTVWQEFYRLIMYDSSEERYKLSGIGQRLEDKYFYPPLDSGKAVVGKPTGMETDLARVHSNLLTWWFWGFHDHLGLFLAVSLMKASALNYAARDSLWLDHNQLQDPLRIPGLEGLVQESKAVERQDSANHRSLRKRTNIPRLSRLSYLPCDILYLILDFIGHWDCICVQSAIQMPVGNEYWRQRTARSLVGIDNINEDVDDLDWRYLCLKLERLYASSMRFETRRRVLGVLQDVKAAFYRELKKEERLRMEDVVRKIHNSWSVDDYDQGIWVDQRRKMVSDCRLFFQ